MLRSCFIFSITYVIKIFVVLLSFCNVLVLSYFVLLFVELRVTFRFQKGGNISSIFWLASTCYFCYENFYNASLSINSFFIAHPFIGIARKKKGTALPLIFKELLKAYFIVSVLPVK